MSYSYDDIYVLHAWRDNRRRLVLTQGEGYSGALSGDYIVKAPRFQLRDEQGLIEIPSSGSPRIQLAVTRPNGTEDLLSCNVEDREESIISCPITKSMTDIAGEVKGEIRLILQNTIIKFYGIDFYVYEGVSDEAAAQSSRFSDLIQALQQVSALIDGGSSGTITLDTVIQHNGTNPVSSGILYDYLVDNYRQVSNAYETISSSYDNGVYIDDATDIMKMYYVRNAYGAKVGILFNVRSPGYNYATQVKIDTGGNITTRIKTQESGEEDYSWKNWTPVGTTRNIQDGAITTEKLSSSVYESVPTNESTRLITSGGVYDYVNKNFRKYQSITSNDVNTAIDQNTLYSVYYEDAFCIMYCVNGKDNRIQYLHKSTGDFLYRCQYKSDDVWSDWSDWKYVASQNNTRRISQPTTSTSGKLWDISWYSDGTYEHYYQLTSIGGTSENPVYNWTELVSAPKFEEMRIALNQSITNQIVTFSYTLTSRDWDSNNEQTITKPSSYVVTSDVMADTEIGEKAYNQLCADGCGGIYISSERNGSNLTLTAHALNHKPTANVTIQVTLTKVNDISE